VRSQRRASSLSPIAFGRPYEREHGSGKNARKLFASCPGEGHPQSLGHRLRDLILRVRRCPSTRGRTAPTTVESHSARRLGRFVRRVNSAVLQRLYVVDHVASAWPFRRAGARTGIVVPKSARGALRLWRRLLRIKGVSRIGRAEPCVEIF
jgi:hypothetical protein